MQSEPQPKVNPPAAGPRIGLALILFLLGAALALRDLSTSNRPHELTAAPYVTVLFAVSSILAMRGWFLVARSRKARADASLLPTVLLLFLGSFILVNLLLLLSAAKTAVTVVID
jgi:hypothetical protein